MQTVEPYLSSYPDPHSPSAVLSASPIVYADIITPPHRTEGRKPRPASEREGGEGEGGRGEEEEFDAPACVRSIILPSNSCDRTAYPCLGVRPLESPAALFGGCCGVFCLLALPLPVHSPESCKQNCHIGYPDALQAWAAHRRPFERIMPLGKLPPLITRLGFSSRPSFFRHVWQGTHVKKRR